MKLTYLFILTFSLLCVMVSCKKPNNEIDAVKATVINDKFSSTLSGETMVAAWYVISADDINALEKINFNLFFLNHPNYSTFTTTYRNDFIQTSINALDLNSKIVLPIDNFLSKNWYGSGGMEEFMHTWGTHPKVYGFLLKDDVVTDPFYFNNTTTVNPNALWIYRWYYKMIRNTAEDQFNSYNTNLAPGKKIIVTLPFDHCGKNTNNSHKLFINSTYINAIPPNFFTPGDAWDVVMPYWYPHRMRISIENEEYIMDELYGDMENMFTGYLSSVIPIMQTAAESDIGKYPLEHEDEHGYDLSIQYNKFISHSLLTSKKIAYYSANGHAGVYDNLLHKNGIADTTQNNIYYREAKKINDYHYSLFP